VYICLYIKGDDDDQDDDGDENEDDEDSDEGGGEIDEKAYLHLGRRVQTENTAYHSPYFVKHSSFFMSVPWLRLILDESHRVRNRMTKAHVALLQLDCAYRWCVSGTPVS
jgi:DNA repair protein RAD16